MAFCVLTAYTRRCQQPTGDLFCASPDKYSMLQEKLWELLLEGVQLEAIGPFALRVQTLRTVTKSPECTPFCRRHHARFGLQVIRPWHKA